MWGYNETNSSNNTPQEVDIDQVYMPFAIDAILIIYNIMHLDDKEQELYINQEDINNLYTKNDIILFDDLFRTENGKTISEGGES